MKSIVQEGSSISKAVESAWQSAGKPQEFTVKVLEEPQHNFIGMTTRSAKVAIFFKEPYAAGKPTHEKAERFARNDRHAEREARGARSKKQPRGQREQFAGQKPQQKDTRAHRPSYPSEEQQPSYARPQFEGVKEYGEELHEGAGFDGVFWTPEMITMAKDWLQGALVAMDMPNLHYSTEVNRLYFKVSFEDPVNTNIVTERQIFRSFAMLLMQHMRNRLKRPLKGFKVVLSRSGGEEIDEE